VGERITTASLPENSNQHKDRSPIPIEAGRNGISRAPSIRDLYDSTLPPAARLIYAVLCSHANESGKPAWLIDRPLGFLAWPSVALLAAESGFSDRGVQKAIAQLLEAGVIKCVFASKGGLSKNGYRGVSSVYELGLKPRTPNSVHPSTVNTVHPKPRTQFQQTPNSVPNKGELSSEELINRTSNKEEQQQHAREAPRSAVAAPLFDEKLNEPIGPSAFKSLESWLEQKIAPSGRAQLQALAREKGFDGAQLVYLFKEQGGWVEKVGGLLQWAKDWDTYAPSEWPECITCDDGLIDAPESLYHGKLPCECKAGEKHKNGYKSAVEEKKKDDAWKAMIANGKCPKCEGRGEVDGERCVICRGTGLPQRLPDDMARQKELIAHREKEAENNKRWWDEHLAATGRQSGLQYRELP
jgi:uncharacterized protein (DUF2267 family)